MTGSDGVRAPKRARLYVTRIDPWSVTKAAFMLALAIGIVIVVAVAALWWVLDVTGVFVTVSRTFDEVLGTATMVVVAISRALRWALSRRSPAPAPDPPPQRPLTPA